jgi:transposase
MTNENVPNMVEYSIKNKGGIIIRKVELRMNEQQKYEVIKKLVDTNGSKERASIKLGVTIRHINRMIKGYQESGKQFFIHGNRGRKPATAVSEDTRKLVLDLYQNKYYDSTFTQFSELLNEKENIALSVGTIHSILEKDFILSPKARKATKHRMRIELNRKKAEAKGKKELMKIQKNLVSIESAHSRRPRCAYFGELEQLDASPYEWFGTSKTNLHIAVDDATGTVTGMYFDEQETLNGYYHVLDQIIENYGIPFKLFTDRRTVFTYKQKRSPSIEEDTYTQFAYACKQLGIELAVSSVPQAKGRVERMFETLQSRLPVELRLAGITDIEAANSFLDSYIKKLNKQFSIPINSTKSVFEMQPDQEKLNLTLAVLSERRIDCGHCIRFCNKYYRLLDKFGTQVHYLNGTKAMVIKAFNGSLFCCVNDTNTYALEEIPLREAKSKNFDSDYEKASPKKQYVPPMNHPWRSQEFWIFVKSQKHHWDEIPADAYSTRVASFGERE